MAVKRVKKAKQPRNHKLVITLNDSEQEFIDSYCRKHQISSKSKLAREVIIRHILDELHYNSPTLFD